MAHRRAFVDFVEGLLNLDPIQRWSPQQAAKHPFITGEKFTAPFQVSEILAEMNMADKQPGPPSSKRTTFPTPESPSQASGKKYGGLVQSPGASRGPRVYSDAAAYNQQLAQHQTHTAQPTMQSQQVTPRQPFGQGYDQPQPSPQTAYSSQHHHRVPSNSAIPPQPNWSTPRGIGSGGMAPPPSGYQARVPSQSMHPSTSHASLRPNQAMLAPTNPPPNSYYPSSRNRANTINQMDAIPPALARLTHFGAPDPSGQRNLTPVLNRDDAMREWERRNASGHARQSSMQHASYPQLEYLQEQAELAAMNGQGWMMPGQYGHGHMQPPPGHGHRQQASASYQMQPHISMTPHSPATNAYRYDMPHASSHSSPGYLPAFPPPAATGGIGSAPSSALGFDGFDGRDPSMGMMYTPMQPSQAYQGPPGGHQARASFSGPYHNGAAGGGPGSNNPFGGPPGQGQGQASPRYNRRSQGYGA
jgi:dual specificity protein kinase YAK1